MAYNLILQTYFTDRFQKRGFLKNDSIHEYADGLIKKYDIRSGQGAQTVTRSMSGGNQQKVILAREIDKDPSIMIVQPARGLDVGATESYTQKPEQREKSGFTYFAGRIMNCDRSFIYEGELVGDLDPRPPQELGLYMQEQREMR